LLARGECSFRTLTFPGGSVHQRLEHGEVFFKKDVKLLKKCVNFFWRGQGKLQRHGGFRRLFDRFPRLAISVFRAFFTPNGGLPCAARTPLLFILPFLYACSRDPQRSLPLPRSSAPLAYLAQPPPLSPMCGLRCTCTSCGEKNSKRRDRGGGNKIKPEKLRKKRSCFFLLISNFRQSPVVKNFRWFRTLASHLVFGGPLTLFHDSSAGTIARMIFMKLGMECWV